jgi:uncharacterized membrane protein
VAALTVLLLVLMAATVVGLVRLWPSSTDTPHNPLLAPGSELISATVVSGPTGDPEQGLASVRVRGRSGAIDGREVPVSVPPEVAADGIHPGDRITVISTGDLEDAAAADGENSLPAGGGGTATGTDDDTADESGLPAGEEDTGGPGEESGTTDGQDAYSYYDHDRLLPLGILVLVYLLVVAVVARGRGLRAVLGLAAGIAVIIWFMVPAIFAGEDPVLSALVAAGAMIFPCVFFSHGISVRTATAVLGTVGGVVLTVLLALAGSRPAGMTGADGDSAQFLFGTAPQISLPALFLAGVMISGLGALNDVTITQASSVWELRAAMPEATRREVFGSAMRIGRDHIASTVYTLAYAYIGTALPTLLLASTIERSLPDTLGTGEIAAEVFRTVIASIGLVLAIPLTTLIATLLAGGPRPSGPAARDQPAHPVDHEGDRGDVRADRDRTARREQHPSHRGDEREGDAEQAHP